MRTLLIVTTVLGCLGLAGCPTDSADIGNAYTSCVTDADCDSHAPTCRTIQLNGRSGSWCTRACEVTEDCPRLSGNAFTDTVAVCVAVEANGTLSTVDETSADRICAVSCNPVMPACVHEGESCVHIENPTANYFSVCVK